MKKLLSIALIMLPTLLLSQLVVTKAPKFPYQIKDIPELKLQQRDSVKTVSIFQATPVLQSDVNKIPKRKGSLLYKFEFDEKGQNVTTLQYNKEEQVFFTYQYEFDSEKKRKVFQKINRKSKLKLEKIFQNNRLLEKSTFSNKGKIKSRYSYSYKNDTLLERIFVLNKSNDTLYNTIYTYDSLNRITERKTFKLNQLIAIQKPSYNKNNEIDKLLFYPSNYYGFNPYKFIENISEEELEDLSKIDIPYATAKFLYNKDGHLHKIMQLKPNSSIKFTTTYKYSPDEKLLEVETKTDNDKNRRKVEYEYNTNGKLVRHTIFEFLPGNPIITYQTKAKYDETGRLNRFSLFDYESYRHIIHNFEYEFY